MSTLIKQIVEDSNLEKAFIQTRKGDNKYRAAARRFFEDYVNNLHNLQYELTNGLYQPGGYNEFMVFEPKPRLVHAPEYRDKIVQLAIINIIKEIYYPVFIHDSYSCIDKKGTHACAMRIHHFIKKAKWEYGDDAFIIKIDIRKFFYSIDREILKRIVRKKIKCPDTLELIFKIIDSANQLSELGLPLGNPFSQIGSNIYMNEVDQFAKRVLGLKYYVRYADDIIIVVEDKEMANDVLCVLREFISVNLNLATNDKKTKIFPINQGVNAIGYKIYATHMLLRDMSKKKIKRKVKAMRHLLLEGRMTIETAEQMLNSWKGHANYACSFNFISLMIEKYLYIWMDQRGRLKINREILYMGDDMNVIQV